MNIANKTVIKLHRISGLVIALFFAMWFISGIVLLYHKYPKVTQRDTYARMESLRKEGLPAVYDIPGMSDTTKIKTLSVRRNLGRDEWTISGLSSRKENAMEAVPQISTRYFIVDDSLVAQPKPTPAQLDSIAKVWANYENIIRVDTLLTRQQWVLYERYEKSLPILRYYFDDPQGWEIFISQNNGEVLQASTKTERLWSWFGAIPHKLYIPSLRTDVDLWKNVITIGGLLCFVASLSGLYLGVYFLFVNRRKRHSFSSPFRKKLWRYHHIGGLIFGLFLVAWGLSGSLSTQRVPKWLVNYEGDYFVSASRLWGKKPLKLGEYRLDYRKILDACPSVKSISWEHFGSQPAYRVVSGQDELYIDASLDSMVTPLSISSNEIERAVKRYFGDEVKYRMTLQDKYDEYYLSTRGDSPLPVWRVDINNSDGVRLYISPSDGYVKYLNHNRMVKKWLFAATHYLDIRYFVLHKSLRYLSLWILALGCLFVIVTGVAIYFTKGNQHIKE